MMNFSRVNQYEITKTSWGGPDLTEILADLTGIQTDLTTLRGRTDSLTATQTRKTCQISFFAFFISTGFCLL